MPSRRRLFLCGGVLSIGLALLGAWLFTGQDSGRTSATHPTRALSTSPPVAQSRQQPASSASQAASTSQTIGSGADIPAETLVATIRPAGAPGSQTPGGPPTVQVPGQWWGAASVLPVIAQQPGWVEVRLAQRPNESVAWVPSADLSLASDPYYIVVDLDTTHLQLFKQGRQVGSFPRRYRRPVGPHAHRPVLRGAVRPTALTGLRSVCDRHLRPQQRHQ